MIDVFNRHDWPGSGIPSSVAALLAGTGHSGHGPTNSTKPSPHSTKMDLSLEAQVPI